MRKVNISKRKLSFKTLIRTEIDDENHFPDHLKCSQYFLFPTNLFYSEKEYTLFTK
jgi:hypothetical protein